MALPTWYFNLHISITISVIMLKLGIQSLHYVCQCSTKYLENKAHNFGRKMWCATFAASSKSLPFCVLLRLKSVLYLKQHHTGPFYVGKLLRFRQAKILYIVWNELAYCVKRTSGNAT